MANLGQTRVFGQAGRETVVLGLRRRLFTDSYHRLVAGSWARLFLVYALIYFLTAALLEVAHWSLAGVAQARQGSVMEALVLFRRGASPEEVSALLDPRALAASALSAVDGFVRWAELVIGAGIVMAKFSRQRAQVLFSEVAVISPYQAGTALLFRMANQRSGHVVDARASLLLVRNEREADGELVRRAHDLPLVRGGTALFQHAWTTGHAIDRQSPLYGETEESLGKAEAELLVTLSGYDDKLLTVIHARHVYPVRRLRFGARFAPIAAVLPDGRRALDYRRFHEVVAAEETEEERPRRERAS